MTISSEHAEQANGTEPRMESVEDIMRMNVWNIQSQDRGFQPLYSVPAHTASGNGAVPSNGAAPMSADQALADAYAKGFAEGERLKEAALAADQLQIDRLTTALLELKPHSDAVMTKMLLKCVNALTRQMIGRVEPDSEFLQQQAEKLGSLIQDGMRDATLHVHPEDLNLFGEFECGVNVMADPGLMRGTLRLVHGDGWIEQGSQPLLDELQAMLDEMEQAS